MLFPAQIKNSKLEINREKIGSWIKKQKDGKYVLSIEEANLRSAGANNYWHGIICKTFGDDKGYTIDESCQLLKKKIGWPWYYEKKGEKFYKSTQGAKIGEMVELTTLAEIKIAEEGIILPDNPYK